MRRFCAVFFLYSLFCASTLAQNRLDELTPEKRDDIKKLMVVTGSSQIGDQLGGVVMESIIKSVKSARPDVPDRVFTVIKNELMALFKERMDAPGGLFERVIPIFDKYYTHSEIKGLLAFYQTDLGRKAIEVMPKATSESIVVGQAWGESLGPEIVKRIEQALKKEGIELPDR